MSYSVSGTCKLQGDTRANVLKITGAGIPQKRVDVTGGHLNEAVL